MSDTLSQPQGAIPRIGNALQRPTANMTWTQLGAVVVFVTLVLFAWRQVTLYIMREI